MPVGECHVLPEDWFPQLRHRLHRQGWGEYAPAYLSSLHMCPNYTRTVIYSQVHRLVIQTTDGKLDGIISLSDILAFLMQDRKLSQTSVVNQPLLSERLCQPTLSYVPAEQQNSMMTT